MSLHLYLQLMTPPIEHQQIQQALLSLLRCLHSDFWYEFFPGERIGVVGPNGAGKSTMLNLIADTLPLSSGEREMGETTAMGFFTQEPPTNLPQDMSMADYLRWGSVSLTDIQQSLVEHSLYPVLDYFLGTRCAS